VAEPKLPAGFWLEPGERVLRSGKDWSLSLPVFLTTRRLICPVDPSARQHVGIPLSEIRDVRLRKPIYGFTTVIVDYGEELRASFPAHINAARIREDIRRELRGPLSRQ
jgi:hypothetical protein